VLDEDARLIYLTYATCENQTSKLLLSQQSVMYLECGQRGLWLPVSLTPL